MQHASAGQFLEHKPTSQKYPAEVYKQAPKHIIVHFSNLWRRGERLQRLLLMHGNSPISPEEYTAGVHPLPLRGEKSKLLLYASIVTTTESLDRASGPGTVAEQGGDRAAPMVGQGRCSSTSVLPGIAIHFVNSSTAPSHSRLFPY